MMKNHDISVTMKTFVMGMGAGVILTHIAYILFFTKSAGLDGILLVGEALALRLPGILFVICAAFALAASTVIAIVMLRFKSAKSIVCNAQEKADMILRDADVRLAQTITRQQQLELVENTRKQTYTDKTDKWLEELRNLQRKNQELVGTIASLKTALRNRKKRHYQNIAASAAVVNIPP